MEPSIQTDSRVSYLPQKGKVTDSKSESLSKGQPISQSTKSVSNSKAHPRLSRTLKRNIKIRDFLETDIKYFYADEGLKGNNPNAKTFHDSLVDTILNHFNYGWIIEKDGKAIGACFAIDNGPFINLDDLNWFTWTTPRNKIEGSLKLLTELRKKFTCLFHCKEEDKGFYVHLTKYGVSRRIGKIENMYDKPAILFQTRS